MWAFVLDILALVLPLVLAGTNKLMKGKMKYVVAIVAYFVLKKMATEAAKQKALSEIQSPGYQNNNALATLYKQAMNPSGVEFFMSNDGTHEDLIFELASKTTNYTGVYNAYRTQFKRDLTADLQDELTTDEYKRFLDILNKS